jgi:cytochrome o ubiquinol oxidase subunit 1
MFGRLTLDAFVHDWIEIAADLSMILGALFVIFCLSYYKKWKWLWNEWLTSLDPKKIGMMYVVVSAFMLLKGFADALMIRAQQVFAVGDSQGYLTSEHFQQVFSAHGTTMIFFVAMGALFAVTNLIMPLQIGARDVAFPFLNSISFYFFAAGALLLIVSLMIGEFSATGWVSYPPLAERAYSPGVGVDYWIWSVQIAGIGSLFSGINFLVTIFKMRCPGMTLMKMPVFIWAILGTMILIIFAFPILTATISMLALDRIFGTHFFTADGGGNPMMYVNLIWAWGHPEVYIVILPAFGIFSEVVATFSQKKLFGYVSMIWAIGAIVFLSFIVWLHHFFTMGAGGNANAFFGIMTMLIAIPTGVKIFNWLFTMARGKVLFTTPMLWFIGFIVIFTTGGMTGVLMSIAAADFQVHNSLFLIAHFHSMLVGGTLFGFFSGFSYWYSKFMGYHLHETLGKLAFWCWMIGFLVAFMPLYALGLMGATRRLDHYDVIEWRPFFIAAGIGAFLVLCGVGFQILQIFVSFFQRKQNRDTTGDPWNGRTLEWATPSPPPFYNFALLPDGSKRDAFWDMKQHPASSHAPYEPIHMPKNTPIGLYIGAFGFLFCFGVIWFIHWMTLIGFLGIIITMIVRLAERDTEYYVTVAEIKKIETENKVI